MKKYETKRSTYLNLIGGILAFTIFLIFFFFLFFLSFFFWAIFLQHEILYFHFYSALLFLSFFFVGWSNMCSFFSFGPTVSFILFFLHVVLYFFSFHSVLQEFFCFFSPTCGRVFLSFLSVLLLFSSFFHIGTVFLSFLSVLLLFFSFYCYFNTWSCIFLFFGFCFLYIFFN